MDRARFDAAWSKLREMWPPFKNQNDGVIKAIYYRRLQKFKTEAVEAAMGLCLEEFHRFPSIAHIVERIPSGNLEAQQTLGMAAMNEKIRQQQAADKKVYRVVWLCSEDGVINGYKLEDPKEDAQYGRYAATQGDRTGGAKGLRNEQTGVD